MKQVYKMLTALAGIISLIIATTFIIVVEVLFPVAAVILSGAMIYGWLK